MTYQQLGVLFRKDEQSVSKYFQQFLPILKASLHTAIYWPKREEHNKNMQQWASYKSMNDQLT